MLQSRFAHDSRDVFSTVNANGNYSGAPVAFILRPFEFELFEVNALAVHIQDTGRFDNTKYGTDIDLANGISVVGIKNGVETDLTVQKKIFTNTDWKIYSRKMKKSTYGAGDDAMFFLYEIEEALGEPFILDGSNGDRIEIRLNDDLTGLNGHFFRFSLRKVFRVGFYGMRAYSPAENWQGLDLFLPGGYTPTIYNEYDKSLTLNRPLPGGTFYPLFFTAPGLVRDVDMSCVVHYEGMTNSYENYLLAKGIDENNFVGVTSYNGKIMLYQRSGGAWQKLSPERPAAGTRGRKLGMKIQGNRASLYIDDVLIGSDVTAITGEANVGLLLRGHPEAGKIFSDYKINKL